MTSLLYFKENVLDNKICDEIIEEFNKENKYRYDGVVSSGTDKNIKDTLDLSLTFMKVYINNENKNTEEKETENNRKILYWENIIELVKNNLLEHIKIYFEEIKNKYNIFNFDFFKSKLFFDIILVQKYTKNKGKFTYHEDSLISFEDNKTRIITFLIYLNDVDEGGETEFFGNFKIKPQKGKLLLFPATWCYPHCGLMPISNNKYILTGWIYININS